jgi:hypothetical protein
MKDRYLLTKDENGPLLLDVESQTFQRIEDTRNKYFAGGSAFDFRDSIGEAAELEACVTTAFVVKVGEKGKRTFVELLSGLTTYRFWSVEMVGDRWTPNEIAGMREGVGYLLFTEAVAGADNGVIIKRKTLIRK